MSKLNPVAREFYPQAATVSINRLPQSHSTHTTIGFLNICSLRYKIDTLSALIRERTWDVVGIAETWLDASIADGELNIEGYSLVRNDRKGRKGGGVCIFYRSMSTHCILSMSNKSYRRRLGCWRPVYRHQSHFLCLLQHTG